MGGSRGVMNGVSNIQPVLCSLYILQEFALIFLTQEVRSSYLQAQRAPLGSDYPSLLREKTHLSKKRSCWHYQAKPKASPDSVSLTNDFDFGPFLVIAHRHSLPVTARRGNRMIKLHYR